jgi:lipoprotein-anchoring transpeptidase ErfK/SrfK
MLRTPQVHGAAHDSRIVISLAERRLKVVRDGEVAGEYEIAIGKPDTPTPTGEFRITVKQLHPGPATGLFGARWMEFYRVTTPDGVLHLYGIHGTNAHQRIGSAVSRGWIRLRNHDVEEVYREAYIGEPVEIVPWSLIMPRQFPSKILADLLPRRRIQMAVGVLEA